MREESERAKDTVIVRFIVFYLIHFYHLICFMYCISFSHPATICQ